MLQHGGDVQLVAARYGIADSQWLDLSTGVSPIGYPIPPIPGSVWRDLPQSNEALMEAASDYYQTEHLLPTAGTQQAIQTLPHYRLGCGHAIGRVWVPKQGYKEHEKAWRDASFDICHYRELPHPKDLKTNDVVVVINPNNPTGQYWTLDSLAELHDRLVELNGWLVVDEAFNDCSESYDSVVPLARRRHCFVLRSIGKFFGLAGIRAGFVIAHAAHLQGIQALLGPWAISGPAQFVTEIALRDRDWQSNQRATLSVLANRLSNLLGEVFSCSIVGTNLFKTLYMDNAPEVHIKLCRSGIYTRLTDEKDALRFGVPSTSEYDRLQRALTMM